MKRTLVSGVILFAFAPGVSGTSQATSPSLAAPPASNDFIQLRRTVCFGWCPAYTVRLYRDGRLTWHGERYVKLIGDGTAKVGPAQANSLLDEIQTRGFWKLSEKYYPNFLDGPSYITTVSIGGQSKTVTDCVPSDAPTWLRDIGEQIDSLDPLKHWIGPPQMPKPQQESALP